MRKGDGRYALRIPAAATIATRDDFEQMPVQVFEIETASTVMVVGLALLSLCGVSPSKVSSAGGSE